MKTIKKSIICKNVTDYSINSSIIKTYQPVAGDVAIFEVVSIGSLNAIQDFEGRNTYIFEGDKVMLTFGNRYATNQFEAYVPQEYQKEYDFVGKGGVVGIAASMYYKLLDIGPTKLKLIGFATDAIGKVINTIYYNTSPKSFNTQKIRSFKTILSIGSSMDSGKTTTAAYLCRGLKNAGHRVAYMKLTGTVFNKDKMLAYDCGADVVTDFSEYGFPSTYLCSLNEIMDIYESLLSELENVNPDYVVIEVADGLYQRETRMLLEYPLFTQSIDHVILSCCDSLAVNGCMQMLSPLFGEKLFALGGLFTASPLLIDEVEKRCSMPILTLEKLVQPNILTKLLRRKVKIAV
ncbi:hypothetical protein [Aquimarina celericrescens]|uniref:DUF1611 domain-containing protein n=1 Tax=Aquimarina celericrescens TaxID=1964542 RepID=A0ABW5AWH2_9FLAO|nr:hypothetical protein [Aquimarina celericrescens]